MAQQIINIGTTGRYTPSANSLYVAFDKCNDNFTELYGIVAGYVTSTTLDGYFADPTTNIAFVPSAWITGLGLGTMATQNANSVAITGGSIDGITDLAIADGGTGASTAANARTNLGLGSMATQNSSNVSITGGTITGTNLAAKNVDNNFTANQTIKPSLGGGILTVIGNSGEEAILALRGNDGGNPGNSWLLRSLLSQDLQINNATASHTFSNGGNVSFGGIVTATGFSGDGTSLTGIPKLATNNTFTAGQVFDNSDIQIVNSGSVTIDSSPISISSSPVGLLNSNVNLINGSISVNTGDITVNGGEVNTSNLTVNDQVNLSKTITPSGTTGNQVINKTSGSVNFGIGASSLTVTNSLVSESSVIIATVATNDATLTSVSVEATSGSFTINGNGPATAETRVNFLITN